MKRSKVRPVVEILSILFLLYTNLLMGQFLRTPSAVDGQSIWAIIKNIVTPQNLVIGLVGATIGFFWSSGSIGNKMNLTIYPLTPDRLPALEDLFGEQRIVNRCWCMYWRIGSEYRKRPRDVNKAAFCELVKSGPPPGLLAFDGDLAVGWCQLTPRDALPWLDRTWRLKRVDDVPVWSLSCFYIRKGYRKRGVTSALIAAALETAKNAGAPALEAYPLDANLTPSASDTGYVSTFEHVGFKVVARRVPPRPIMRYDFQPPDNLSASPRGKIKKKSK